MEVLFRETTNGHLQGIYSHSLYSYDLQPGVITVEGKSNKEPQEDDTCSQAMTAKGWTRPSALNSTDSGIKK